MYSYTASSNDGRYVPGAQNLTRTSKATATRDLRSPAARRLEVEHARQALLACAELVHDWDGYGAEAIGSRVRLNAWRGLEVATGVGLVPDITPRTNGTVSFEWDVDGIVSHLQIGAETFSMYVRRPGRATKYISGSFADSGDAAIKQLRSFVDEGRVSDSLLAVRV